MIIRNISRARLRAWAAGDALSSGFDPAWQVGPCYLEGSMPMNEQAPGTVGMSGHSTRAPPDTKEQYGASSLCDSDIIERAIANRQFVLGREVRVIGSVPGNTNKDSDLVSKGVSNENVCRNAEKGV